jgi:hypothetical protein
MSAGLDERQRREQSKVEGRHGDADDEGTATLMNIALRFEVLRET